MEKKIANFWRGKLCLQCQYNVVLYVFGYHIFKILYGISINIRKIYKVCIGERKK